MFLRRCERQKNGKKHTYWALVESYRTARGSRQRVVAHLGELKAGEETGWRAHGTHTCCIAVCRVGWASTWTASRQPGGRSFRCSIRHRPSPAPKRRWQCGSAACVWSGCAISAMCG